MRPVSQYILPSGHQPRAQVLSVTTEVVVVFVVFYHKTTETYGGYHQSLYGPECQCAACIAVRYDAPGGFSTRPRVRNWSGFSCARCHSTYCLAAIDLRCTCPSSTQRPHQRWREIGANNVYYILPGNSQDVRRVPPKFVRPRVPVRWLYC